MNGLEAVERSRNFNLNEFTAPEDLIFLDPKVIWTLDGLRDRWGLPIHPSRDPGGLVRRTGRTDNRHYTDGVRLTDAIDIFPEGPPAGFLVEVLLTPEIHGIGVYGDTKRLPLQPGPMFHIDLRPDYMMWVRKGEYVYRHKDPRLYYSMLQEILNGV